METKKIELDVSKILKKAMLNSYNHMIKGFNKTDDRQDIVGLLAMVSWLVYIIISILGGAWYLKLIFSILTFTFWLIFFGYAMKFRGHAKRFSNLAFDAINAPENLKGVAIQIKLSDLGIDLEDKKEGQPVSHVSNTLKAEDEKKVRNQQKKNNVKKPVIKK